MLTRHKNLYVVLRRIYNYKKTPSQRVENCKIWFVTMCWKKFEKFCENAKKLLIFSIWYGIIYEQDCTRYALKREVAAFICWFFRGVCPILNRAKEYFDVMVKDQSALCVNCVLSVIMADCILPYSDAFVDLTRINWKVNPVFKCWVMKHPAQC